MERLQKLLARAGVASRRHAEDLIRTGAVSVNGRPVTRLGALVDPHEDEVRVHGEVVRLPAHQVYLALHKPQGYLTSVGDPWGRPTVMDLVPRLPGLFPVGRLDADSEGLLLLTNDGDWAQAVLHPRYGAEKEYVVDVRGRPSAEALEAARRPVDLDGERTTGARARVLRWTDSGAQLSVTLHEGRKRQLRRVFTALGYPVERLVRVRIGTLRLGDLPPGEWRPLRREEVDRLGEALMRAPRGNTRGSTLGRRRPGESRPPTPAPRISPQREAL